MLSGGAIVERGRHLDLLAAQGIYADMWVRQQAAAEAERTLRAEGHMDAITLTERAHP